MKATNILHSLYPAHLLRRHRQRQLNWQHWGEHINARGLTVTEDEMRNHNRLTSHSRIERLADY